MCAFFYCPTDMAYVKNEQKTLKFTFLLFLTIEYLSEMKILTRQAFSAKQLTKIIGQNNLCKRGKI